MKQPKIHIKDIYGSDFGIKNVKTLYWDEEGKLTRIKVDFSGTMDMYIDNDINNGLYFKNSHNNLVGNII